MRSHIPYSNSKWSQNHSFLWTKFLQCLCHLVGMHFYPLRHMSFFSLTGFHYHYCHHHHHHDHPTQPPVTAFASHSHWADSVGDGCRSRQEGQAGDNRRYLKDLALQNQMFKRWWVYFLPCCMAHKLKKCKCKNATVHILQHAYTSISHKVLQWFEAISPANLQSEGQAPITEATWARGQLPLQIITILLTQQAHFLLPLVQSLSTKQGGMQSHQSKARRIRRTPYTILILLKARASVAVEVSLANSWCNPSIKNQW